jgi:HAD superfamily hydrolase (TIGR01549 family)
VRGVRESETRRLADAYSEIRRETGMRLFEGVPGFLADLRARYRVGILTNGPSDMQWEKLRKLGLTAAVDAIVVAGDFGVFKPDPRPFRRLTELLGTSPPTSLFVGDSYEHDIVGARGAGMRTAWVTADGAGGTAGNAPDHVVERAIDLREVLL